MRLSELKSGQVGLINRVRGRGPFRKRITEMGFIRGKTVKVIKNAPLKDPIEYKLMDYNVSLRRSEAAYIDVQPIDPDLMKERDSDDARNEAGSGGRAGGGGRGGTDHASTVGVQELGRKVSGKALHQHARYRRGRFEKPGEFPPGRSRIRAAGAHRKLITVALVGNPNCGKTSIFNYASGLRERVGNYGGVTVQSKEARIARNGYLIRLIDLPGTYSITEYSPEELFVRNAILNDRPDVVLNVIDASNLERNLYLTTQLIEMDLVMVAALNMYDELKKKRDEFDHETLGRMLGIPFVPTVGPRGEGIGELIDKIIEVYERREETVRSVNINYGLDLEKALAIIEAPLCECTLPEGVSPRYAAIKLLEKDTHVQDLVGRSCGNAAEIISMVSKEVEFLEAELKEDRQTLMADARFAFIAGALKETFHPGARPEISLSDRIDSILTHRLLGIPVFLFFLWLTFELTFSIGQYPLNWIQTGVEWLSHVTFRVLQPGLLRELLTDGIIPGVGGVLVFVPNILILFFMISLMEDTGYMARAAFIMDRFMHSIGLHGKSFIPLMMGFGCSVPAIMATRTLESRKDRLLTMLIIPFMSCSARLPVYVLFIGAFFPNHPGSMLFALYLTGALVAIGSAMIMKKTLFRKSEAPFVMELPSYRLPRFKNTLRHMWDRSGEYFKKIGGIVLIAAVLIWALSRFPSLDQTHGAARVTENARLEHSYIGMAGKFIEPALHPLGFDWKMGVSLVTGLAAKEVTVSTLGILYHVNKDTPDMSQSLIRNIQEQTHERGPHAGRRIFNPITALAYLIFILLYIPCIPALVTMRRESGSWKWPAFSALFSTTIAWSFAFLIHQVGMLLW